MTTTERITDALSAYRLGDHAQTAAFVAQAARAGSLLAAQLETYLAGARTGAVYDQPRAFTAFIRGGGNVELYRRVSRALADRYDAARPESLLDLGCGDGLALLSALRLAAHRPARIDLVEPSGAMLETVRKQLPDAFFWEMTGEDFLTRQSERRWAMTQSTFALQSMPPTVRTDVLGRLRPRTGTLVIAEFDVPPLVEGSRAHLGSLAARYERGIAEYGDDASLVAQGFLIPVLLGVVQAEERTNWESPAHVWAEQLTAAGFADVTVEPLLDYWWAPAVLISARG
jgi:hypothetical protein